jgi:TolB-like protein
VTGTVDPLHRKLTAILYADVAGYTRLSEQDESRTHRLLSGWLDRIAAIVGRYGGRVEHYAGDAVLAELPSVVLATACALAIQARMTAEQSDLPQGRRFLFRVGINLGEVIVDRGEIYGTDVNVAARLETLAEAGGICVSDTVRPVHRRALALGVVATIAVVAALVVAWLGRDDPHPRRDERPSLAVLPFENLNRDPSHDYFVDGLTDDLITDLSRVDGLLVIARGSSAAYKGATLDDDAIARELGVRYLVRGTLRRAPQVLRVNTRLVDARTGETLWAERYDVEPRELFGLQERIVRGVWDILAPHTGGEVEHARGPRRDVDLHAYDLFLQGWAHFQRETPDGWKDAIPFLEGAAAHDPHFVRPHAVLAAIYYLGRLRHWNLEWGISSHDAFRLAYEHLIRGTAEANALGLSIRALTHVHNGRHQSALSDARAAVAREPSDATAHIVLSQALSLAGMPRLALEHARHATRLNPRYPASYPWSQGLAHFVAGELESARASFESAGFEHPGLDLIPVLATYALLGDDARTDEILRRQRARWERWRPGASITVRSLAAAFPPMRREADQERLARGLAKALARIAHARALERRALPRGRMTLGPAGGVFVQ